MEKIWGGGDIYHQKGAICVHLQSWCPTAHYLLVGGMPCPGLGLEVGSPAVEHP